MYAAADGCSGFDCKTPICRFRAKGLFVSNGLVVSCLNGAICGRIHAPASGAFHYGVHFSRSGASRAPYDSITGYIGTDCSIPKCVQGFWDHVPWCYPVVKAVTDVPMVETAAQDYCSYADWTGYDCSIPVCVAITEAKTVYDLLTVDVKRLSTLSSIRASRTSLRMYRQG